MLVLPTWALMGLSMALLAWLLLNNKQKAKETKEASVQCSLAGPSPEQVWETEAGHCYHWRLDCPCLRGAKKVVAKRRCMRCG